MYFCYELISENILDEKYINNKMVKTNKFFKGSQRKLGLLAKLNKKK